MLHQSELIPSYIKTFNQIISLESLLRLHNIDYYFFNTFYQYEDIDEPKSKIDKWGRENDQLGLSHYKFGMDNMFDYIKKWVEVS